MSKPLHFVGNLSGGICSWAACKLQALETGPESMTLLFADTIVEDDDLYRFLVETAANILDIHCPAKLIPGLTAIPTVDRMPERKAHLAKLRVAAMEAVPGLVWLADGRTPWEVYRDEKYIGNSRVDPCSKILKRQLLDRWMNENHGNARPTTPRVVGLGEWERERFEGHYETLKNGKKVWRAGLAERMAAKGWVFRAPLIYFRPTFSRNGIYQWLDREGIDPPALSEEGFDTNNCGGVCCKMGLKQAAKAYHRRPERYRYSAAEEKACQEQIGTDCTMLRREVDGKRVPLSLIQFGEELATADAEACSLFPSQPACGCFTGEDE